MKLALPEVDREASSAKGVCWPWVVFQFRKYSQNGNGIFFLSPPVLPLPQGKCGLLGNKRAMHANAEMAVYPR